MQFLDWVDFVWQAQFLGWAGLVLIEIFYVPQLIRTVRTRNVVGLSLTGWSILWAGMFFYLLYSIAIGNLVFTVGNAIGVVATGIQIALILKYRKPA